MAPLLESGWQRAEHKGANDRPKTRDNDYSNNGIIHPQSYHVSVRQ